MSKVKMCKNRLVFVIFSLKYLISQVYVCFLCVYLSPGQTRKHCCRNICDSQCFLECFPIFPPMETLLQKQILLPGKQECFLSSSETFDVSLVRFLLRKHYFSVCPPWEP
jgi:hypothetical protein